MFITWIKALGFSSLRTVVDVGANHGDFSLAASAFNPDARIILFEPLPKLHPELKWRINQFSGWKLDPRALGAADSRMKLQLVEGKDDIGTLAGFSDEYLASTQLDGKEIRSVPCKVTTLDKALEEHGLDSIDLLKIDVEGFELAVLQGATSALDATEAVIIEVSCIRNDDRAFDAVVEVMQILDSHGLRLVQMLPSLFNEKHSWLPLEYNLLLRRAPNASP